MENAETHLKETFSKVFPKIPKPENLVSDPRHIFEVSEIVDLVAEEITHEHLVRDMFRWLTTDGFLYYLPAFVRCTLADAENKKCILVMEQNWMDLASPDDYRNFFLIDEKWRAFSQDQRTYLYQWNSWILSLPAYEAYYGDDEETLFAAKRLNKILQTGR